MPMRRGRYCLYRTSPVGHLRGREQQLSHHGRSRRFRWFSAWAALAVVLIGLLGACSGSKQAAKTSFSVDIGAGQAVFNRGNFNAAQQLFQRALQLQPSSPLAHYDLGTTYGAEGQTDSALEQYALALRSDPNYWPALYNQATIEAVHDPALA